MVLRTDTTSQSTFPGPGVIFEIPSTPAADHAVTITVPPGSLWTTSLHWHETHTEYVRILRGRARVTLGSSTRVYTPSNHDIVIAPGVRHEYMRADADGRCETTELDEDPLVILEWTRPADGSKEIFFRNVLSVYGDSGAKDGVGSSGKGFSEALGTSDLITLALMSYQLDNFPVIVDLGGGRIERMLTHTLLRLLSWVARGLAYGSYYPEYTPVRLREAVRTTRKRPE